MPNVLQDQLSEISTQLSAQWVAVMRRTPDWQVVTQCGGHALEELPYRFFEESLDRDEAGIMASEEAPRWSVIAVPMKISHDQTNLLLLAGRNFTDDTLFKALAFARAFGYCLRLGTRLEQDTERIHRLRHTLEIALGFAGVRETQPLLDLIAKESTHLLQCDRASIFIWDREHHQVIACPALGVEGRTLKLPDDAGIVGEVIQSGNVVRVDDAYQDVRFNKAVDKKSGYTTRNILCVPMRDIDGKTIGAFQAINKEQSEFTDDDEELLTQLGSQAAVALHNTREREGLVRSHRQLTQQVAQGVHIIGESPGIVALRATIERLAPTDLPVLLLGESGTGKEVVCRSLHFHGPRAAQPFVAVNCVAIAESLLESELFGHEKGAFTDARETRQGKFELAEGGTLFLDEIGDMSLSGQAKLLRVLDEKMITRVGGAQPIPIDVRIIAATNANLMEAVRRKRFREDLYYRLSVVTLELLPLRERPEDILALSDFFLKQFSIQAGRPELEFSAAARRHLQVHNWPGNVRELRNLMERVAFLCPGQRVQTTDLAFILSPERDSTIESSANVALSEATKRFQQEFIRRAIKRVNGNMSEAAKLLGLHRSNLYRKMRHLEMHEGDGEKENRAP